MTISKQEVYWQYNAIVLITIDQKSQNPAGWRRLDGHGKFEPLPEQQKALCGAGLTFPLQDSGCDLSTLSGISSSGHRRGNHDDFINCHDKINLGFSHNNSTSEDTHDPNVHPTIVMTMEAKIHTRHPPRNRIFTLHSTMPSNSSLHYTYR